MTTYVNESSAMTVRARFFNETGALVSPTTSRYLIRDVSNDRLVRDWTSLSPAATVDISVTATDNELYESARRNRKFERRVVTVQADTGTPTQRTDEIEYWVRDLAGLVNE
jgi:hypothetical protein